MTLGRVVLALAILVAFPALVGAQGISNRRDVYGNLVRDNGIAAQNAPAPHDEQPCALGPIARVFHDQGAASIHSDQTVIKGRTQYRRRSPTQPSPGLAAWYQS